MIAVTHTGTPVLYLGFSILVAVFLALDFVLLNAKGKYKVPVREALVWAAVWFVAAMVFAGWYWWYVDGVHGREVANTKAIEYVSGYLIEKALATENVFVWVTIFTYFAVPPEFQKRVLLYGVIGAIVMRAVLIFLGLMLIEKFDWMFYVFGLFLFATGVKMLLVGGQKPDLGKNPVIGWIRSHMRVTDAYHGERFLVMQQGRRYATPLFLVLVLVEVTDLIFSVDSIPAIFAVTTDPFVVFTSNIFAILVLRAMYFVLADMAERFHLLNYGLALIVMFIGVKMLIVDLYKIPIPGMLGTVFAILVVSIGASLLLPPARDRNSGEAR
ncbi:MAG: TerC family protein [Burkholderiales bacterium]|nr:TerC family protein [Burkholderiales bacterium]